ncbi:MAG: hypothetical protein ACPLYE_01455 [Candidatus Micrarchaeales archaeon]
MDNIAIMLEGGASILLIAAIYMRLRNIYKHASLRRNLIEAFYLALGNAGSKPLLKSLEEVAESSKNKALRQSLKRYLAKELIEGGLADEIGNIFGVNKGFEISYRELDSLINEYEDELRIKVEKLEPALQRDATIAMFISTIAPSFIILGFIGLSILSASWHAVLVFLMLIVALPTIYSACIALSQRRLINAFGI